MKLPEDTKSRHIRAWIEDYEKLSYKGNTDAIAWIALKLSISRRQAEQAIIDATTLEEEEGGSQ